MSGIVNKPRKLRHDCEPPDWRGLSESALWRCDCGRLWRVGPACDLCDFYGDHSTGQCTVGRVWRPARMGQRIRYWRSRP
jgi:hypothetical protein